VNPTIVYIDSEGAERSVLAEIGDSVMETAVKNDVEGIVGECGGSMSCCSCHVYVLDGAIGLGEPGETEDDLLDSTMSPRQPNSRLSCQLKVTEDLDGARFLLPEEQL
jgi:ferredoxin, 2Fe-2S